MSAHELETIIGAVMLGGAYISAMYALPSWIVRRCER